MTEKFMKENMTKEKVITFLQKQRVYILFCAIAFIGLTQLEFSDTSFYFRNMEPVFIIINYMFLLLLLLLLYYVIRNAKWSIILFSVVITVLSIANYYTLMYHGTPLSTSDLYTAGTAVRVLNSYNIRPDINSILLLAAGIVSVGLAFLSKSSHSNSYTKITLNKYFLQVMITLGIMGGLFWYIFVSPISPKPENTVEWSWKTGYYTYGYLVSSVEAMQRSLKNIDVPQGYSLEEMDAIVEKAEGAFHSAEDYKSVDYPDIIMILNESFYDLSLICDYETNEAITPNIDALTNAMKGSVVVCNIGGGTNNSEYELLTSNSLQLMQSITPFYFLNMNGANSVVSYLKELGYYTAGFHADDGSNYNRINSYAGLGFDDRYFVQDMGEFYSPSHGSSHCSDMANYEFVTNLYEKRDDTKPFFLYNLTMQNHGAYNIGVENLVEIEEGFQEVSAEAIESAEELHGMAAEYLSCIKMSDEAFGYLTEYFSQVDRPVIICMMGDHSPSFVNSIACRGELTQEEMEIYKRSTPYVIWANFPIDTEGADFMTTVYMTPTVLEQAGLPLSYYYETLLELKKEVPILSDFGIFQTNEGENYAYTEETPYSERITEYWYMEYNNVAGGETRKDGLFTSQMEE